MFNFAYGFGTPSHIHLKKTEKYILGNAGKHTCLNHICTAKVVLTWTRNFV